MGGVNITGYRMVNTKSSLSQRMLHDWVLYSVRPRRQASAMLMVCRHPLLNSYSL